MPAKPPQPETVYQLTFPSDAVSFDAEKFDELIRSQGVELVHFRSMACPVGLIDPDDIRRGHDHHQDCSNGRVYTKAGLITCGFLNNSGGAQFQDYGRLDGSTVSIVLPRFYDDQPTVPVDITYADRVYLKEEAITVTTDFRFAAHISGVDRLCYPVLHVIDLMDSKGKRYQECVDFEVRAGQLHWKDGRGPGVDPDTGKGVVCSARFSYRPFWYVKSLPHEVRVAKIEDEFFRRSTQQMPKHATLQREYHYEKAQRDAQAKDPERRQHKEPSDGSFGPR